MDAEKANYGIARMARLLNVSRSGCYAWRSRPAGPRARRQEVLDAVVRDAHRASDGVYGAPRVRAELAASGIHVDVKTVAASMRRQGLEGVSPRTFRPVTTIPGIPTHAIPDLVGRRWDQGALNQVWISDITYLRTGEGWLYLAVVRDACSRRVLGWAMDRTQTTDLVERALRMAHTLRGDVPEEVVFHADRGTQYTSDQAHDVCEQLGLRRSAGRTGVCWDNAMAESFWSTLKTEFYDRRSWPTRAEAKRAVGNWIETFYNRRRRHSALDYASPVDYERQLTATGHDRQQLTLAA